MIYIYIYIRILGKEKKKKERKRRRHMHAPIIISPTPKFHVHYKDQLVYIEYVVLFQRHSIFGMNELAKYTMEKYIMCYSTRRLICSQRKGSKR